MGPARTGGVGPCAVRAALRLLPKVPDHGADEAVGEARRERGDGGLDGRLLEDMHGELGDHRNEHVQQRVLDEFKVLVRLTVGGVCRVYVGCM